MECQAFGAKVVKLDGLISDCGKYVAEHKDREGWYDVSTLKEPIASKARKRWATNSGNNLREAPGCHFVSYGRRRGSNRMCKAFDEMQRWVGSAPNALAWWWFKRRDGAPIVKAWDAHKNSAEFFPNATPLPPGCAFQVPWEIF